MVFTGRLEAAGVAISMDRRRRALDNVFVARLWWTVKYENVYLKDYALLADLEAGLMTYWDLHCYRRRHQLRDTMHAGRGVLGGPLLHNNYPRSRDPQNRVHLRQLSWSRRL